MLEAFEFSFLVTGPIFFIICAGIILKKRGIVTEEFAKSGSDLVFNVALPALLFSKIVDADFSHPPLFLIFYACASLLILFIAIDRFWAPFIRKEDRGAFVQGILRSNVGIVGLAYCLSAFGDSVVSLISVYLATIVILVNTLCVVTLCRHNVVGGARASFTGTLKAITKNPLIVTIVFALILSALNVKVSGVVMDTLEYLAKLTLPLALICVGATIRWHEFQVSKNLYLAIFGKLVLFPGVITLGAIAFGFRGQELGVLYLMSAAPTAAASYPMIRSIGGNQHLTAAIIAATSIGAMLSTTVGLFFLRSYGLI